MATNFGSMPLIDIGPLVEKWNDPNPTQDQSVAQVVQQLDKACKEVGFFYVTGHGIPVSLVTEIRSISRQFFDLPSEEKLKIKLSPTTGYRGYQRVGMNITKGVPDLQEAIDCYKEVKPGMYGDLGEVMEGCNQWPSDLPRFKDLMEDYIHRCTDLSRKIIRGIAMALGGPSDMFEGNISGEQMTNDHLKILMNGIYESTVHRVMNNSEEYRVCVAYFYETNYDAAVEPLEICVERSGGVKKIDGAVVYGKHLVGKVLNNFVF